jgi:hypothetical protein
MIKTNHYLIKGGQLTDAQKDNITGQFLASRSRPDVKRWGSMYPAFYIPTDRNERKYQTVVPMSPKTEILSQNSYELEIIRLLHMFAGKNKDVIYMVDETLNRLKKTCFGYKRCSTGECFESGIITLRFLSAVAPTQKEWIKKQISVFNGHYFNKRRHSGVLKYFWLCLYELPFDIAEPEILRYKDNILNLPKRKIKNDDDINLVLENVIKNTLSLLPEYQLCTANGGLYLERGD